MTNPDRVKVAIQTVVKQMMDRVMNRVMVEDPFIVEDHRSSLPLYAALVPDEIFKGAHFERRFCYPIRQGVGSDWQK